METKEIKIEAPEGYEIDKENSTFEKIVFKKKAEKKLPESWLEYRIRIKDCAGYCAENNEIHVGLRGGNFNEFCCREEAKAFIALGKLIQLRDEWWNGWEPSYKEGSKMKYIIRITSGDVCKDWTYSYGHILIFPTPEMRDSFLDAFKGLIEEAKMFL